jgi:Family of unknown function (DUF6152)
MTSEVVIEGRIVDLEWRNPHIAMTLEVTGADGEPFRQEVELASVSEVRALGVDRDELPIGATVALRAHPGRRGPEARVFGLALTRSDGTLLPLHPFAGFANVPEIDVGAGSLTGRWAPGAEGLTAVFGVMMSWPYTDAASAALQDTASRAGSSLGICEDFPPPLLSIFPDLRQIEVGDNEVTMHFEAQGQNLERVIHMHETAHPADVEPSLLGHSIGRWEGETLVVDTIAFTPHPHGAFAWVASGPDKHLVERFTLAADRLHLQYDVRMEDPESLTGPATFTMLWDYRPDLAPSGVACDPEIAERLLHE